MLQANQGAVNPVAKTAGGLKIAAGGAGVTTSAAFAGSNVFASVTEQEQARHLQAEIAAGLTVSKKYGFKINFAYFNHFLHP